MDYLGNKSTLILDKSTVNTLLIISETEKGHWASYIDFLRAILEIPIHVLENCPKRLDKNVVVLFLNPSKKNLIHSIRLKIQGINSYMLWIAIEEIYLNHFEKNNLKKIALKSILRILKKLDLLRILTIHKGAKYEKILKCSYTNLYDFQYYDLHYRNVNFKKPKEISSPKISTTFLAVINTSSIKYDIEELQKYLNTTSRFNFIIVSKFLKIDRPNVIVINRYIEESELLYLYDYCDGILALTTTNRPSGIFGRAMQMDKFAVIYKNSYNSSVNYPNSIEIESLSDIDQIILPRKKKFKPQNKFDQKIELRNIFQLRLSNDLESKFRINE